MRDLENKIVVRCGYGFQWVQLNSPEAKKYERKAMGHCIGQDEYDDTTIFSLRDKDNIPHITVEFDERINEIERIQGKGNTKPNEKYYNDIFKLYKRLGVTDYFLLVGNKSYAIANGKIYIGDETILSCPEDTVFDFVYLSRDSKITKWNYSVSGDFKACSYNLEYVNPKCKFGGKVNIRGTRIKEWHCNVGGDFDASGSKLEYVNPKCKFGGSIYIWETLVKEWHNDVPDDFDASGSKLEYVTKCKFGGKVNIRGTNIKEWHCNVPDDFDASGSKLEYVDTDCKFGGIVDVSMTNIKEWHCDVPKYFNAESSKLEYVNPKCKFSWSVNIRKTMVKEWHCKVSSNFDGYGSKLQKIDICKIKGRIVCNKNVERIKNC
ncbi:PcfJ domain-containing protein [Acetobacter okinawensis]|uniref:PcfJ domain-containing protein n=1 Tax=Acetobacter okinawensis TaxID=1076594 RepID=UPI001BA77722|nr:PcfJ domain-containing protein [Acetobacter okinawensis]MBS0987301.1 PcfJ domain-containing protein [Acetobacter okinawensis]